MIDRYNILKNSDGGVDYPSVVRSHLPKITDADYQRGYIRRFFAQKSNDESSPIIEISKETSSALSSSPYYVTTSIRWRITGNIQTENGKIGVSESNRQSILLGSKKIKNLSLYLPNLLQFHK